MLFQKGGHQLFGRAGVRSRLEYDSRTAAKAIADRRGRDLDVTEIGRALAERRGDGDDRDVEAVDVVEAGDGPVPARGNDRSQRVVSDVLDVRVARVQSLDLRCIRIEPDDVESDLDGPHGEREADIALADDNQAFPHGQTVPRYRIGSGTYPTASGYRLATSATRSRNVRTWAVAAPVNE